MSRLSPLPLRLLLLGVLVVVVPACGKRGPPLPPLRPAPDKVTDVSVVRREDDVTVRFSTPVRNSDGSEPVLFDRVEIYALTIPAGGQSPNPTKVVIPKNRLAVLGQRPPAPPRPVTPVATGELPPPPPAVPLVFVEKVATVAPPPPLPVTVPAPGAAAPPSAPRAGGAGAPVTGTTPVAQAPTATTPAVAIASLQIATRFYVIVPYANRSRVGTMSDLIAVPLGPVPPAPKTAAIKYDETTMTLSWVTGAVGQTFHVYESGPAVPENARPVTPAPLAVTEFKRPVVFGARVCFAVRGVRAATGPVTIESPLSNLACETPMDIFPPPVPTGLIAFAAEGAITLTWDGVTASDLAGYIVLRGEGAGATLQPLMTTPLAATSFIDSTARPGVRYVYAVVSVDSATPGNRSKESNRVEETGRSR